MFATNDSRSTLSWSNRLGNFRNTQVYNFYSSGEEVLGEYADDPPLSALGSAELLVNWWALNPPGKSFVWVWQEKSKGVAPLDTILGSTHGGWKFNTNPPYYFIQSGTNTHMSRTVADALPPQQLQTNAFFDMSYDFMLFSPSGGSAYAQANRERILSDAIPAVTWAVGSHPVPRLQAANRNFNMNALYQNDWPQMRLLTGQNNNNWWHSDFRDVAFTYVHPLFNQFVTVGNLK
jgi:hypothetical protein